MERHRLVVNILRWSFVVACFVTMAAFLLTAAWRDSQTIDEAVHLSAGYSSLRTGDFRLNPEHPPLIKLLSAPPLLTLRLHLPTETPAWQNWDEWSFGSALVYSNRVDPQLIMFVGRLANVALSLLLAVAVWWWTRRLFGNAAALFALVLTAFNPTILAHGHLVTTDLGVTLFSFLTVPLFGQWLQTRRRRDAVLFFTVFAAAQMSKFSAIILIPTTLLLLALWFWREGRPVRQWLRPLARLFGLELLFLFLAALLLYGPGIRRMADDPRIAQLYANRQTIVELDLVKEQAPLTRVLITLTDPETKTGKTILGIVHYVPVPLYAFFRGLAAVYSHNYGGHLAYLLGGYSETGWWYYFPVAFLVKTSSAILALLLVAVVAGITALRRHRRNAAERSWRAWLATLRGLPFHWWLVVLPPVLYVLVSFTSRINIGVRHLLPIDPFIAVGVSALVTLELGRLTRWFRAILVVFAATVVLETVLIAPQFIGYFNAFAGGTSAGPRYLVDSNIDWGQDLYRLRDELARRHIDRVAFSYFGTADVNRYVTNRVYLPTTGEPDKITSFRDVAAVSITALLSREREYGWLLHEEPLAWVGTSIILYDFRDHPPGTVR